MKALIIFFIFIICIVNSSKGQDTVYYSRYPKGIVTNSITISKNNALNFNLYYHFSPINNPTFLIEVKEKEISMIKYGNKNTFVNTNVVNRSNEAVLSTDPLTAKIFYTDIIESKNVKIKDLFNTFKTLSQAPIKYDLVSSDETEYSFQKYNCSIIQHGTFRLYFDLLIKFKDGKIKYEYSNFVRKFSVTSSTSEQTGNNLAKDNQILTNTTTANYEYLLEINYANLNVKNENYTVISNYIIDSIETLKKLASDVASTNKDW